MMSSFAPGDAVGVIGLPAGGLDPTRDHAAAAAAVGLMTGTRPSVHWRHHLSWEEAGAYERRDGDAISRAVERECPVSDRNCPRELQAQALEMLGMGRGHAQTVLTRLGDVLDKLADVRAPKSLVLFSGGIPFDVDLLSR
jgi:hypothetical protein